MLVTGPQVFLCGDSIIPATSFSNRSQQNQYWIKDMDSIYTNMWDVTIHLSFDVNGNIAIDTAATKISSYNSKKTHMI